MKRKFKRVLSAVVSFAIMLTVLATPLGDIVGVTKDSVGTNASAAGVNEDYVWGKISELKQLFPTGSYFTKTGTNSCHTNVVYGNGYSYCYSLSCPDCKLANVLASNPKAKNTIVPSVCKHTSRYSCFGFATFVFCYIFGHDTEENKYDISSATYGGINDSFLSKLKPGDLVVCNGGAHYAIYLGYDSTNIYLYESNYDSPNQVEYYHARKRNGLKWSKMTAIRSNSYSSSSGSTDTTVKDYYRLTAPDGYQVIRSSDSTSSSEVGRIPVTSNTYVCVTKYNSAKTWGYVTYNGVSGWIRLYYVEKHSTHSYSSSVTSQPTCTTTGVKTYKCSCGSSYTESVAALGHSYSTMIVAPTCTSQGYTLHTCSRCSTSYKDTYTNAKGHSYGPWVITKEATCTTYGEKERTCPCGGAVEGETIPQTAHNYVATAVVKPTYTAQGYTFYKCSNCDESYKYDYTAKLTLPAVSGLTLGGRASNALRLNWNKNSAASGYIIEQYKGGKWVRIAKITSNATTTYRVTGLSAGTAYKFRMRAYRMSGTTAIYSGYTATLAARTNPSNVTGLKIGGKAQTALRLNWTKNTSADGYIIEMYKGGKWVRAAKITNNATVTYRKSGLAKNTTYKFRIKAYKMSGTTALYSGYTTVSGRTTA